ncbi:cell wall protein RBR3-like, partial [Pygocentrus nattereri]|uniref:cell wall protein RBR3-like n=1 Tax=Pygocentrus nattereri TaxID=42514 RepID=UPI001891BEBD
SASSLYSSQDVSSTSTYKPSVGALGLAQSTYQQGVSYRPVQSTLPSSFVSRAHPYASSFKPSTSTSKPVQSGYQQKASDQPVQTASQRVSSSQPVTSSYQQVASSQPVASSYQQVASAWPVPSASQRVSSAQPVQSAYQQVASTQPVWRSSPPSFVSQKVGFDSSAVGLSGSRAYSYTTSLKPSTSASQPVQSTYQQKPVQTASQSISSAQPVLSSYRSGLYSQNVGFDSSVGTGSGVSSYTSSFRPPTSISKPVPSSYQQVTLSQPAQSSYPPEAASQNIRMDSSLTEVVGSVLRNDYGSEVATTGLNYRPFTSISTPSQSTCRQVTAAQPVQSRYQDVPFSQTSYGASLSGVTSTGSRSLYTPSDSVASVASAQAFRSPYSYAQALSSLDNSQPSAGSPRLTWTQKVLE